MLTLDTWQTIILFKSIYNKLGERKTNLCLSVHDMLAVASS